MASIADKKTPARSSVHDLIYSAAGRRTAPCSSVFSWERRRVGSAGSFRAGASVKLNRTGEGRKAIAPTKRGRDLDGRLQVILIRAGDRDYVAGKTSQRQTGPGGRRARRWRKGDLAPGIERHGAIDQPEPKHAFRHKSHGCLQQSRIIAWPSIGRER